MCKRTFCLIISLVTILFLGIVSQKTFDKPKPITRTAETVELENIQNIPFHYFNEYDFTCTGLTWDTNDQSFWIGDYGALSNTDTPHPRVVEVNGDLSKVIRTIDLSKVLSSEDNLQGVAYDKASNSLWLAVGTSVKNVSKDGDLLSEISLNKYSKYKANGICIDDSDNTIWVLCYSKYLLHYDKSGTLIKEIKMNFKDQDQIIIKEGIIYATIGADYHGNDNYVVSINKDNGEVSVIYQPIGAYAMEGLCFVNGKMYIANDGAYHNAKINESYISIYNLNVSRLSQPAKDENSVFH